MKNSGCMITDGRVISPAAEEDGSDVTPGCGYPLIGDDLFTWLEHPAAFSRILKQSGNDVEWELRHHPVWNGNRIECIYPRCRTAGPSEVLLKTDKVLQHPDGFPANDTVIITERFQNTVIPTFQRQKK